MPILSAFGAARIVGRNASTTPSLTVSFLLVGGGGGSGHSGNTIVSGGGGGGGEVRETLNQAASVGVAYDIGVGVGGAGSLPSQGAENGGTTFYRSALNALAYGGGKGGSIGFANGGTGGTGGGGYGTAGAGGGVFSGSTGYPGFAGYLAGTRSAGSGGGGAGFIPIGTNYIYGGTGLTSSITGLKYGGGGSGNGGTGGDGGGGSGFSGTVNTGGGGGGSKKTTGGWQGGSGVVVLKIPEQFTATFSGGVTSSVTTSAGFKIYTVTVAGAGQTVTFS